MFEDSLLESAGRSKVSGRRLSTTIISVAFQSLLIGIAILIPLIYTDALPKQQLMTFLVAPPPPPPPPPPPAAATPMVKVVRAMTELDNGALRTPTKIPTKVAMLKEDDTPPPSAGFGVPGGVPGGVAGGSIGGVLGGIISSANNTAVVPKMAAPQRIRVSSGVTEGMILQKVTPQYPPLAKQARIQGHVLLSAVISKDGQVEGLKLISGHPMLAPYAIEAVKKWRYKPYYLNGEPVEVETTIDVNFSLSGG
jgi:periplasmic protein TonB